MPLQNRVAPDGSLHAVMARGTMLGNRGGKFHRDDQTLSKRRWASHHWICCELHYKSWHHEPMGNGYTSLFFLDEVTALAAGHRPCGMCRHAEKKSFLRGEKVESFDRRLHAERMAQRGHAAPTASPDGTMFKIDDGFWAKRGHQLLRWSFDGYVQAAPLPQQSHLILTPPSIINILEQGYQPRWHESALNWDERP